jgi:hypothetical protein
MLAAAIGLPGAAAGEPARQGAPDVSWLDNFAQARERARRAGKPLLVVFR